MKTFNIVASDSQAGASSVQVVTVPVKCVLVGVVISGATTHLSPGNQCTTQVIARRGVYDTGTAAANLNETVLAYCYRNLGSVSADVNSGFDILFPLEEPFLPGERVTLFWTSSNGRVSAAVTLIFRKS